MCSSLAHVCNFRVPWQVTVWWIEDPRPGGSPAYLLSNLVSPYSIIRLCLSNDIPSLTRNTEISQFLTPVKLDHRLPVDPTVTFDPNCDKGFGRQRCLARREIKLLEYNARFSHHVVLRKFKNLISKVIRRQPTCVHTHNLTTHGYSGYSACMMQLALPPESSPNPP